MDLVGAPAKNAKRKAAQIEKANQVRTREDVDKEINESEKQLTNKKTKTSTTIVDEEAEEANEEAYEDDDEADEDDNEADEEANEDDVLTDVSNSAGEVTEKPIKTSTGKKFTADIIRRYPSVKNIGLYLYYDDNAKTMYTANRNMTETFYDTFITKYNSGCEIDST